MQLAKLMTCVSGFRAMLSRQEEGGPNRRFRMNTSENSKRNYRFGLFEADPAKGELLRQGVRIRLQDQPFRLLVILLERAGEVVTREELRQKLWSSDTYVEFDGSLGAALKRLRFALGDSATIPIFIETLSRRGYRFIAPVAVQVWSQNCTLKSWPWFLRLRQLLQRPRLLR